jgi:hypothetical protein
MHQLLLSGVLRSLHRLTQSELLLEKASLRGIYMTVTVVRKGNELFVMTAPKRPWFMLIDKFA